MNHIYRKSSLDTPYEALKNGSILILASDQNAKKKGVATLTGLETVTNGATLLCTQTFERDGDDGEWMLTGHTTIPYGADVVAKVVLRCDANGCVALPAKSVASSNSR